MRICFYAASCLPIHGRSLEERPLGGTETGIIRVAAELALRGHDVTVVTSFPNPVPGAGGHPSYINAAELNKLPPFELFVAVKDWRPAFFGFAYKRCAFWTGDGFEIYSNYGVGDPRVAAHFEKFLAASSWHARTLCEESGMPLSKAFVLGNGIHPDYFVGREIRNPRRIIYTSAPYRGLELMPAILKALLKKFPDLEFHVFAGMDIYNTDREFEGPHVAQYKQLAGVLSSIPGVTLHGNVTQRQLSREYMKSAVYTYPNIIGETCCITALEAQAAGCPVVASAFSALPETVGEGGILIDKPVGSLEYLQQFAAVTARLLSDDQLRAQLSEAGMSRVRAHFTWERVTDRFEAAFR
jgi:glycosyltransferase involved in cell wall biosynthesis